MRSILTITLMLSMSAFALENETPRSINSEDSFRNSTDVKTALNLLPGKALSLPFILDQAIKHSDSFQTIIGQLPASKAPELAAAAALDVYITGDYTYTDNTPDTTDTTRIEKNKSYTLGVSKLFQTGTTLSAALDIDDTEGNVSGLTDYHTGETTITFGLEQSLWKDFFGYSTRRKLQAGELEGSVVQDQVLEATEDWSVGIAQTYYQAWLNKERVIAAREKLKRQQSLSEITKLRVRRGSSAKPELLQIESAAIAAKTEEAKTTEELNQSWRYLIAVVKLPRAWYTVDPVSIPMLKEPGAPDLDAFCEKSNAVLTSSSPEGNALEALIGKNPKVARFQRSAEASKLKLEAQRMEARPDLKFKANYGANGVSDENMNKSFSEATDFTNKFWALGVELSMPLGFRANKALVYQETANRLKSQAEASNAITTQELDLLETCANIKRLKADSERLNLAVSKQKERSKLEQQRFRTGRIPILNAIQASNDLSDTELLAAKNSAELHISYWQLKKLKGDIYAQMKQKVSERE